MEYIELWNYTVETFSFLSAFFSTFASIIVIYLFLFKRAAVTSLISFISNYSYQLSLSELKEKLEKLNDYSAKEDAERETILNILHDIVGQVRGNSKLSVHLKKQVQEIELYSDSPKHLTEPRKRALVSELKERLRTLNIENMDDLMGGSNE